MVYTKEQLEGMTCPAFYVDGAPRTVTWDGDNVCDTRGIPYIMPGNFVKATLHPRELELDFGDECLGYLQLGNFDHFVYYCHYNKPFYADNSKNPPEKQKTLHMARWL